MSTILRLSNAAEALADCWESDAERISHYDPEASIAKVLRRCAADLRLLVSEHEPEWVPIRTVQDATGQSMSRLRARCRDLAAEGLARKGAGGRWQVALDAAREILRARRREAIGAGGESIDELARRLGRET